MNKQCVVSDRTLWKPAEPIWIEGYDDDDDDDDDDNYILKYITLLHKVKHQWHKKDVTIVQTSVLLEAIHKKKKKVSKFWICKTAFPKTLRAQQTAVLGTCHSHRCLCLNICNDLGIARDYKLTKRSIRKRKYINNWTRQLYKWGVRACVVTLFWELCRR
jgi:hypothetical protein